MKRQEAYSILEIPETATADEAKKKYRELTKKYHPDVNKEAGAEAKFKKINEAYNAIKDNNFDEVRPQKGRSYDWGAGQHQVHVEPEHIQLHTTISFKDSVLGCKAELKFNRKTKCATCSGNGAKPKNNGCDKCGGRGQTVIRQGATVMISTCDKCYGRTESIPCTDCKSQGVLDSEASVSITVPGGIQSGNILRLGGMGNYAGTFMGHFDQHTDVFLHVNVTPEPGLSVDGNHVVSTIQISLLEALTGCKKTVKTVLGEKEIDIKPKSRNKEEVILSRLGVNGRGDQRVILDVQYPSDIEKLVQSLKGEESLQDKAERVFRKAKS